MTSGRPRGVDERSVILHCDSGESPQTTERQPAGWGANGAQRIRRCDEGEINGCTTRSIRGRGSRAWV